MTKFQIISINPILRIFACVLAACTAGASVILTVAINPGYGGLVLAGYILIFLVLPIIYLKIFGSVGQIVKEEIKSSSRKRIFKAKIYFEFANYNSN